MSSLFRLLPLLLVLLSTSASFTAYSSVLIEAGESDFVLPGCTDPDACNYDPLSNEEDGSCLYIVDCFGTCGGNYVTDTCGNCFDPDAFSEEVNLVFNYTGAPQSFTVPNGVFEIHIEVAGASGHSTSVNPGGLGGLTSGTYDVFFGQELHIYVGGEGTEATTPFTPMGGGWNGGGHGMKNNASGNVAGGGGGASDVRTAYAEDPLDLTSLLSRILVGGGGGGATNNFECIGGAGGGLTGATGGGSSAGWSPGIGGSQLAGGNIGGALGQGGSATTLLTPWIGGGGGGFYGGGCASAHAAGGGGSSFVGGVTNAFNMQGGNLGDGYVVISYFTPGIPVCLEGCTNAAACNFDPNAGVDDGSCILPEACTDPEACNFDPTATCDDQSCTYAGCNSPEACNFDPLAGCDDGSCTFFIDCNGTCGGSYFEDPCGNCYDADDQEMVATFTFVGSNHTWIVPEGVTEIQVELFGAEGANGSGNNPGFGGLGAHIAGILDVTPGETLTLVVGGLNGFNGGGLPGNVNAGNGGGASDIRSGGTSLANRVAIAAGGGGGGANGCSTPHKGGDGGNAGGGAGQNGTNWSGSYGGGFGGQLGVGGAPGIGCSSSLGTAGQASGNGGNGTTVGCSTATPGGGGGGGGLQNGGGGGGGSSRPDVGHCKGSEKGGGGGGAGGSNLTSNLREVSSITANNIGNGRIIIRWDATPICDSGCTEPTACNYDPQAGEDDGSCILPDGCTNPLACNYEETAQCDDASCTFSGCTDAEACNFNPEAGCDDGSCQFESDCLGNCGGNAILDACGNCYDTGLPGDLIELTFAFTGHPEAFVVPWGVQEIEIEVFGAAGHSTTLNPGGLGGRALGTLSVSAGDNLYLYIGGQGSIADQTNTPMGGGWNGGGNGMKNSASGNVVGGGGGATDVRLVVSPNPTDPSSLASRVIVAGGGGGATNNSGCVGGAGGGLVGGTGGGSSAGWTPGTGGTQTAGGSSSGALGQGGNATLGMTPWNGGGGGGYYGGGVSIAHAGGGGGSSYFGGVTNGQTTQGVNSGNGVVIIRYNEPVAPECNEGCTDESAANYDPAATIDDGSCIYLGCTDVTASNYSESATVDDGSCIFSGCTDPTACNYDASANTDDGSCDFLSCFGCTYAAATNFDPTALFDDGSCIFMSGNAGCTYPTAVNYDPAANVDDGSCVFDCALSGCTDPEAINFMTSAVDDDGSCIYDEHIYGCIYTGAINFNPTVTRDNGSCVFIADFSSCPADLNNDGVINASDLSIFLSAFGTFCQAGNIPPGFYQFNCEPEGVFLNELGFASVIDADGNVYRTLVVGGREWMAENLRTTRFANGDLIPNAVGSQAWSEHGDQGLPAWVHLEAGPESACPYGNLYNGHTVTDCRNVCPAGWHVPTESEFNFMSTFLGGASVAGGKLKNGSTDFWLDPNTDGTNSSGFSGLPAGLRNADGSFNGLSEQAAWWLGTTAAEVGLQQRQLTFDSGELLHGEASWAEGASIRCIKD